MNFPSEESLKVIREFNSAPESIQKQEIRRQYLSDEISNYDFVSKARALLSSLSK